MSRITLREEIIIRLFQALKKISRGQVDIRQVTELKQKILPPPKREIKYLSDVQADGLTSTVNTFIETDGIFTHLNHVMCSLKNSLLPVTIYEVSRLLKKYPQLNSFYSEGKVSYYKQVHVGFAIDLDKGLKVLKIPGKAVATIENVEEAILNLSGRYLDDRLSADNLEEITFTITDLSAEDVAFFKPL